MPQSSPQSKPVDGVVKHRACDECRSRKLACTKEPDGCSRYYSNINYLELLSPLEGLPPSTLPPELSSLTMAYAEPRFTDMLLAHVPETAPIVSPPTSSEISHTLSTSISIPESPSSANTNADDGINQEPEPAIKPYNNTSCSCLSQIFLSLDSLSRLPNDVKIAMAIARSAARVAHDVIHCPACSLTDITKPPPMQAFQNTMMLGAILPSTANAYAKILELIDSEAAQAKKEGRCIKFCFAEYGGLWGELRRRGKTCGAMDLIDNREMDPDDWRLSVRGLLKIDVYGHDFEKNNGMGTAEPYHHLGLRDVIKEMEDRSNNRHNQLDDMVAAGLPHPMLQTSHNLMIPQGQTDRKEDRHCLKIIEIARVALDKLVIA